MFSYVISSFSAPNSTPRGLAFDASGNLWHSDSNVDTIYKLDPTDGTVLDSFAAPATNPIGLAFDSGGNLWSCDSVSDLIYKLDPADGTVLDSFASPSDVPTGLAWDGTSLWHCDNNTDLIYKLDPADGTVLDSFATPGLLPDDIAFDPEGNLWHTDSNTDLIYKLDPADGTVLDSFASPGISPTGLAFDSSGVLWHCDLNTDLIYEIDVEIALRVETIPAFSPGGNLTTSNNTYLTFTNDTTEVRSENIDALVVLDSFASPSISPNGLASDSSGNLWNCDSDTDLIYKLNPVDGTVLSSFASPSTSPQGLAFDSSGNLWNCDSDTSLIYKLDPADGTVLDSFATPGDGPRGLAFDSSGNLWHSDSNSTIGSYLIYKLNPADGTVLDSFAAPSTDTQGIAFDSSGNLWNTGYGNIYILDPADGTVLDSFASPGGLSLDIAFDPSGNLWDSDFGTNLIYKLQTTPTPPDFMSMQTLGIRYEVSLTLAGTDDSYFLATRVMDTNLTTVLAAADASGAFSGSNVVSGTTDNAFIPTYQYVNTSATKTQWDNAVVQLQQTHSANMGSDGAAIRVDHVEFTGRYLQARPNTPTITAPTDSSTISGVVSLEATVSDPGNDPVYARWELWNTEPVKGTVESSFASPNTGSQGIAWDGANLWNVDSDSDLIYKLDSDGSVVSSITAPTTTPRGLAWDGTNLWCHDRTDIYKVDPSDGTVLDTFVEPISGIDLSGITYDGQDLWVATVGIADKLCRLSTVDGTVLQEIINLGVNDPSGVAWDGTYLYFGDGWTPNMLGRVSPVDEVVENDLFELPASGGYLAYDGTHLRLSTNTNVIYAIELYGGAAIVHAVAQNTTTVASGATHTTFWDVPASGVASADYLLKAWTVDPTGGESATYDEISITVNQPPNTPVITAPADLSTVGGTISLEATVSDPYGESVYARWELRLNSNKGTVLDSFGTPSTGPTGLTFDTSGNLWTTDFNTDLIYKLNPADGTVLDSFATPASTSSDLAFDSSGNLWHSDSGNDLIYILDPADGTVLDSFASPSTGLRGIAFDSSENLWTSDTNTDLIYKLDSSDGTVLDSFAAPGSAPTGLAFDSHGNLWHSDIVTDLVYKLDPSDGTILDSFAAPGNSGENVAFDTSDNLWLLDWSVNTIYKLNPDYPLTESITPNTTTVTSGSTHTTSWDSSGVESADYLLRAWAIDARGLESATYDEHSITISGGGEITQVLAAIIQSAVGIRHPDPITLSLSSSSGDVVLDWPAPGMPTASHTAIFRRAGTSTTEFDPEVDTEIARVPVGTLTYTDSGVADGDYVYQVIPVEEN